MARNDHGYPWWQRNAWGLVALAPALVIAVLASSFRLVSLYLPWEPRFEQTTISQDLTQDGVRRHREVRAESVSISEASQDPTRQSAAYRLWVVKLTLAAPPDADLSSCRAHLIDSAGREYQVAEAAADDRDEWNPTGWSLCDAKAPGGERPSSWTLHWRFVLPPGAQPDWLRVAWPPDYLKIPLR